MRLYVLTFCAVAITCTAQLPVYPVSPRGNVVDTIHGEIIPDPYRWLEKDRDTAVVRWATAQNDVTKKYFGAIPYRARLRKELDKLNNYERYYMAGTTPGATYYVHNNGRQNNYALYRQKTGQNPELILDPDTWSKDGTITFAGYEFSHDGKWLAFMRSDAGSDWKQVLVMDLTSKKVMNDTIRWTKSPNIRWWRDGFFYSRYPAPDSTQSEFTMLTHTQSVHYHKIGMPQATDKIIYSEDSGAKITSAFYVPAGSNALFRIEQNSMGKSKLFVKEMDPETPEHEVYTSQNGMVLLDAYKDTAYLVAFEGMLGTRIIRLTNLLGDTEDDVILTFKGRSFRNAWIAGGRLFINSSAYEDEHSLSHQVDVFTLQGDKEAVIALEGDGHSSGFQSSRDDSLMYFNYESYTRPNRICLYNIPQKVTRMWQDMPFNFIPENYEVKRVLVPSREGIKIPMTLVYKKGLKFDGKAPTIVYGYGGFGTSLDPEFDPLRLAWLDQGGVYVVANLRGGGEFGGMWHYTGSVLHKKNTFYDAISCAKWLIKHDITTSDRLAINGASNGGLLVGAVMTMEPELFRVAVPQVGVHDMMRFHLFTYGWGWVYEYGSIKDSEHFDVMYDYSPLHNLKKDKNYPSTLIMTADHDDRVVPAHSFKFAAALQNVYAGTRPQLLRVQARSGHGAVNADVNMDQTADIYSFMWNEMGVSPSFAP